MRLLAAIAIKHLWARKRQSLVSVFGIVMGVAFFLAISSLMQGSEKDFIRRLIDNTPHITVVDSFRNPREQPLHQLYPDAAVQIHSVKPLTETRGIRGFENILQFLRSNFAELVSPVMVGEALVSYAGRDNSITLYGMIPEEINRVTTIKNYLLEGSIDDLIANPDGIIIGQELAKNLSIALGDNITVASPIGQIRTFKILGIFRTGRSDFDERQTFVNIKRVQALLNRSNRANNIIIKLSDPYAARSVAQEIESRIGYKAVSWQEESEDLMNTLSIRNIIMYTVVSGVLIVAAFGIYNIISTVVLEKQRDIAILKAMGFHQNDIVKIFILQGLIVGLVGCMIGIPFGSALMSGLMQFRFKPPGSSEVVQMPIDWGFGQFAIAASFAMLASLIAALLPAYKAAKVQPVQILRGSQ